MNRVAKWLNLLLLFIVSGASAIESSSSKFHVTSWRNEEGLPHTSLNTIFQTRDGYLWIGTYVGLVRFDGVRFVRYSSSDIPDLESGRISQLFEDQNGALFIALKTGRVLIWKDDKINVVIEGDTQSNQSVISFAQQTNGTLWLLTSDGKIGKSVPNSSNHITFSSNSPARRGIAMLTDSEDRLWVATGQSLQFWDGKAWVSPKIKVLNNKPVEALARARDGSIWVAYRKKLYKICPGMILQELSIPNRIPAVENIVEAADGRLWVGSSAGSLYYLEPGQDWDEVPKSSFQGHNRILYEDREGNLWRGGFGCGLTRIRPRSVTSHELPDTSLDRYARSVSAETNGTLWAIVNEYLIAKISQTNPVPELVSNTIPYGTRTLLVDSQQGLWVGASLGHLYRLRDGIVVNDIYLGAGIEAVTALYEDRDKKLWVGTTGGAGIGFIDLNEPSKWNPLPGMPYPDVRCIAQTIDGAMWFGTHYGGLFRWSEGHWTRYTMRDGLSSDYIRSILADADGTLWIGTLNGLTRLRAGEIRYVRSDQGLWNDAISHLSDDGRGNFWFTSFCGVFHVKKGELEDVLDGRSRFLQCIWYNGQDGLRSVECAGGFQPSGTTTPDGRLWIPTSGGLVSIQTRDVGKNRLPPPVWIEETSIDDQIRPILHSTPSIIVPPGKRRLDIRYTALSLSAPEKVLFRYRLEGLDNEWSRPSPQRVKTYNYLPPGTYKFQVIACNNDGVWNEVGQSLQINVEPFAWQTWWFKALSGVFFTTLVVLTVRRVEQWKASIRFERLERQHAVERERTRIAKDIHDDLGANLTQIVFLSQRAEATGHNPSEILYWLGKIPNIASRTIRSLDEIVWAINPKHDSLESLANYLSRFAQEFLSLANIRCLLDVSTVLPPIALSAEVRHNLVLTAREALQNVVSHSGATEARVSLQIQEEHLTITIADNGHGFDLNQTSSDGNGLTNMQRRLGDIGGLVEIKSQPGKGTTVTFSLPRKYLLGRQVPTSQSNPTVHEN